MTDPTRLSRRSILSIAAGSVGAVTLGAASTRVVSGRVDHTYSTMQRDGEVDILLDWSEFYNGDQLEAQDTPTSHDSGNPLVTLDNVLPGDTGRIAFGLRTAGEQPAALQLRLRELSEAENGINEPEAAGGDTSPDSGELLQHVTVRGWYDTGVSLAGSTIYGACNGQFDEVGEEQKFEGSLPAVLSDEWRPLDAHPDSETESCLGIDEGICFVLEWSLPKDLPGVDDNIVQSDSVSVEVAFRGTTCTES